MKKREKPYMTMQWAGITVEHYPGQNPYKEGTFHYQMHEQMDETLWNALCAMPNKQA